MDHEGLERVIARRSAQVYIPLALGAGGIFYLAASFTAGHTLVARGGGAVWVTLLSFIVSMPIITARVKKSLRG